MAGLQIRITGSRDEIGEVVAALVKVLAVSEISDVYPTRNADTAGRVYLRVGLLPACAPCASRPHPPRGRLAGWLAGEPGFAWARCARCGWHRFNNHGQPQCTTPGRPAAAVAPGQHCPACAGHATRAAAQAEHARALALDALNDTDPGTGGPSPAAGPAAEGGER